jgi:hypothetical protein
MKAKTFWLARDKDGFHKDEICLFWKKPIWDFDAWMCFSDMETFIKMPLDFIPIKPGECRKFKLVEVK